MRLIRLTIEDFGLIERAELTFAGGFTACTGETGSGKTMLLGALDFALGERSSADTIRRGAARARVTLEFDPDEALRQHCAEEGFGLDDGELAVIEREIAASGKSAARLNGRPAAAAQLRALGERLVERVGQDERQRLLSNAYQRELLDRFAGLETLRRARAVAQLHARAAALEEELRAAGEDASRVRADVEFARFALAEIDAAAPQADEDVHLRERRNYLVNSERIASALQAAHRTLAESDGSAVDDLGSAVSALASVAAYGSELSRLAERVAALQSDALDAAASLARSLERNEFDPAELEALGARLDILERLKRKYGGTLAEVLATRERFARSIERFESRDEQRGRLSAHLEETRAALAAGASTLGSLRTQAARRLEARVAEELSALAMPAGRFTVVLDPLEQIEAGGGERVEFALAPNPGEPLRPIGKVASGGERSRVLLALVVALAEGRDQAALIFDEIDAGIGGMTAQAIGLRLGALARTTQVVCVTHLAQIAAWADLHYSMRKRETAESTTIELVPLDEQRSIPQEIARMLSGSGAAVALEHAGSLIREVRSRKAASRPPA